MPSLMAPICPTDLLNEIAPALTRRERVFIVRSADYHHGMADKIHSSEPGDEALMLAYGRGNAAAFETLYARHKGGLYRYLLRSCSDPADAEEMFQDIWGSVIASRTRYSVEAKFTTWLYRIASNRLTDHYRKQGKWEQYVAEADDDENPNDCAVSPAYQQPERQAGIHQQLARFLECLDELPALQRQVFLLKEEAGLKIEEIAAAVEANTEAVKSRMRYALQRLRLCMGELL